jgi:carbonic anhydrase/acetyltransferase-like protein (isoleucine patch superfamily)
MPDVKLNADGSLPLPPEIREALGWGLEQEIHLRVEGENLLAQATTPSVSLKEEARRLVTAMRDVTRDAVRQVADAVRPVEGGNAPGHPGARLEPFLGVHPRIAPTVYLAPGSTVMGDVSIGDESSVWPGAVLRGDVAPVRVGTRTNIQEGAVLHVSPHLPCMVGNGVTIGHQATVHAANVGDDTLIGIHAVVLDGARIGSRCLIAAGTVVPPDMVIPEGKLVMGVPARIIRDMEPGDIERLHWNADSYVSLKNQYQRPTHTPPAADLHTPKTKPAPPTPGTLPRHLCPRANGPIVIDGALDDEGWRGIPPFSALVLSSGKGAPAQETELCACWDDTHLYLSFSCKDTDIWGNYLQRDDPLYDEEVVEFFLCPTGNLAHYFEFEISPQNVIFDARVFNPTGDRAAMLVEREWNASGLRTAVRVSGRVNDRKSPDLGWIVEAALPFTDLGLPGPPTPGTVWRANFYRVERGETTEFTAWSPTYKDPADFHVPAYFGELVFEGAAEPAPPAEAVTTEAAI